MFARKGDTDDAQETAAMNSALMCCILVVEDIPQIVLAVMCELLHLARLTFFHARVYVCTCVHV